MQSLPTKSNNLPHEPVLRVVNVSKSYHLGESISHVLQDISFTVESGEVVALIGRTGMGKSTILDIIAGMQTATAGSVVAANSIGYVMQKDLLLPWRTILQNVSLPLELGGLLRSPAEVETILRHLGLVEYVGAYPGTLSGGTKQKVSIARVLIQSPGLLLLDEPFSAMDITVRIHLIQYLRQWISAAHAGVVVVTHSIDEALAFADRIIVLKGPPARMGPSLSVHIPTALRDPAAVRQFSGYTNLFNHIWKELSSGSDIYS